MYTSRPTAQGDSPHGALFNKYPSGQTIINIMNCDLLNSFKVLQITCQVIACFSSIGRPHQQPQLSARTDIIRLIKSTITPTPITACARSRFSNFLISVATLRVFFLNFENTKYRDVSLGDELSSGNDLPTEKVSQTTLQIIPERLCG